MLNGSIANQHTVVCEFSADTSVSWIIICFCFVLNSHLEYPENILIQF